MTTQLKGVSVTNGYAFGKAFYFKTPELSYKKYTVHTDTIQLEIDRFYQALKHAEQELKQLQKKVLENQGEEHASILNAHVLVLKDPEFISAIQNRIIDEKVNAEQALEIETNKFIILFQTMHNNYIKERAADIQDIKNRILAHLLQKPLPNLELIQEPSIIVTEDVTPSEVILMNHPSIKGIITNHSRPTSHSIIMAKTLEIPIIINTEHATSVIHHGDELIVDGSKGEIIIHPKDTEIKKYQTFKEAYNHRKRQWSQLKNQTSITLDHYAIELAANIGGPQDVSAVLHYGADGIGLYRTEFLYMKSNHFPTEEKQFKTYKQVLEAMEEKLVIIRTVDIGGDKSLNYWSLPQETNPFLGVRSIRLALKNKSIFRQQLRALLRASCYGNLKIMFPMVTTLEEFRQAKRILTEEKQVLLQANIPFDDSLEVGIMVETPSAALIAPHFAKEVDFFSIGTNDLIQYTFAADRLNENVAHLNQPYHPALLHLLKLVITAAHNEGKRVGICGDLAEDPTAIPLLIGLGLEKFSMNPSSILPVRHQLKNISKTAMQEIATKALTMKTSTEVYQLLSSLE